ncbi:hypothetical protein SK128_004597 [Halocaridina rubra]|uniref:Cytochrome P450 n=1 Tax=Halocaridina rubra TaxID=373956 RepID=A0AAN8X9U4_HALRR
MWSPQYDQWLEDEVYRKYSRAEGICGVYEMLSPALMVTDPEIVKHIMIKDFDHFSDRRVLISPHEGDRIMNEMVFNENGDRWKQLRAIMTPTFSTGKMKAMYPLVEEKADAMVSLCFREAKEKPVVDMKDAFSRFVMDTIATCAFGFESNSLVDKDALFTKKAGVFTDLSLASTLKFTFCMASPTLFKLSKLRLYTEDVDFFHDIVQKAIAARKEGQKRGDYLDLLLEAQKDNDNVNKSSKLVLDNTSIVAQSVLFIIAGYDTAASAMAFTSYLLAKNYDEQQHLRQELQELCDEHGKLTYQSIMEAKYLNACLLETMRLYSPIVITERLCTKPYQIPGTNVKLNVGDLVQFPIWSIHMDEQYWPEPKKFKPERFMPENKDSLTNYTHLPFGLGPRNCLAMRFALMESKLALAKLVLAADLSVEPGHELSYITAGGIVQAKNGIPVVITPLREE